MISHSCNSFLARHAHISYSLTLLDVSYAKLLSLDALYTLYKAVYPSSFVPLPVLTRLPP